jgi:hypothetical protein
MKQDHYLLRLLVKSLLVKTLNIESDPILDDGPELV